MSLRIEPVSSSEDIDLVSVMAAEIWAEYFIPIIGKAQVDYMLERFQSSMAIKSQIDEDYEYYLASIDGKEVGYTAIVPDSNSDRMMLSKIYLKSSLRGKGVGAALLDFVEGKCISADKNTLWLTVNKKNSASIYWYQARDFKVVNETRADIGHGFYMDDYILEKKI